MVGEDDLYSDVRPTLAGLREAGLWVGIAGNQTVRAGGLLRGLDLPSDHRYQRRLNNDIRPAVRAGLLTALIRRGPWGTIQQGDPDATAITTMRIDSLAELPERIAGFNAGER